MRVREVIPVREREPGRVRALLLLSGGLDSILAGRVLEEQGVDVVPVVFESPFFGSAHAREAAERHGWPLVAVDITEEQLAVVERPKHGYGKNMNPCIDCHAQMIRLAGALLDRYGASFVATGEVLGERPKSQNPQALRTVEEESGLAGLVLRPLSARLLPETEPERQGLVDRSRLHAIQGRSRRPQIELAAQLGVRSYPTPGGGCLLTDPGYSHRLRRVLAWRGTLTANDAELVKYGRLLLLDGLMAAIGRNAADNERLEELAAPGDLVLVAEGRPGPTTVARPRADAVPEEELSLVAALTVRYGQARDEERAAVLVFAIEALGQRPAAPSRRLELPRSAWQPYVDDPGLAFRYLV